MSSNDSNDFQDYISSIRNTNGSTKFDFWAGADTNDCRFDNLDIPCGFQDVNPMLFTVIGEIISTILSGNLPSNVANAFGNWLQLIAQVIVTFNAQQAYFQSGPGRYYNPIYRNVANPFCNSSATADGDEQYTKPKGNKKKKRKKNEINELKKYISELEEQINMLNIEIQNIKNIK